MRGNSDLAFLEKEEASYVLVSAFKELIFTVCLPTHTLAWASHKDHVEMQILMPPRPARSESAS